MLNELTRPMLGKPSVEGDLCAVCGRPASNRHHVIQKGMGGSKADIPTVPLCGHGNLDGCHGLAHSGMLFFRWNGGWECCITDMPTTYYYALEYGEWGPLPFEGVFM